MIHSVECGLHTQSRSGNSECLQLLNYSLSLLLPRILQKVPKKNCAEKKKKKEVLTVLNSNFPATVDGKKKKIYIIKGNRTLYTVITITTHQA